MIPTIRGGGGGGTRIRNPASRRDFWPNPESRHQFFIDHSQLSNYKSDKLFLQLHACDYSPLL